MRKDSTFFVNLKKEDTKILRTKLDWILDELESRVLKSKDILEANRVRAIGKPMKAEMSRSEVIASITRWGENPKLKVNICLKYLKSKGWKVEKKEFLDFCKNRLLINKPDLFLLSLTKKPYIREWTNINDEKRKARDYGNILKVKDGLVQLNSEYCKEIIKIWGVKNDFGS